MSALYGPVIAEHARTPRNQGSLPAPDAAAEGVNPLCGDRIAIDLQLQDGRVSAARFRGEACMVGLAAASVLTELVAGLTLAEAAALPDAKLLGALQTELRPSRIGCALLPLQVLRGALAKGARGEP